MLLEVLAIVLMTIYVIGHPGSAWTLHRTNTTPTYSPFSEGQRRYCLFGEGDSDTVVEAARDSTVRVLRAATVALMMLAVHDDCARIAEASCSYTTTCCCCVRFRPANTSADATTAAAAAAAADD